MNLIVSPSRKVGHKMEKNPVPAEVGALPTAEIQRLIASNPVLFAKYARSMQQSRLQVIAVVDAKDPKTLETAGAELDQACVSCNM